MKNITMLIFSLIHICSHSQISISISNFPNNGDQYIYSNADVSNIDISQTGVNINWDYSNLSSFGYDTTTYSSVTSTPFAYQFYFNNFLLYPNYKADYAIKGIEINAFNRVNISDVYNFHKKNNSSLEMVGFGANINGIPASIKYDTIDKLYPLPLGFGVSDSTSAYYLLDIPSLGTYGQHIQRKVEVDGWGSISTPYRDYNSCLRVKTTLYQRDTLKVEQPISLPGIAFNRPIETKYEWFVNGVGVPVFSVTKQGATLSSAKYIDENTSGLTKKTYNYNIDIYPNPSLGLLNIKTKDKYDYLELTNSNGKVFYSGKYTNCIDISSYPSGNYVVSLKNESKQISKIIQKQ